MKREKSDAIDAALRAEPEYKDLCELLSRQSAKQKARLEAELSQQCEDSQGREDAMKKDVDTRIWELKEDEGKTYAQIAELLTNEGYTDSTGNPFSVKAIRSRYYRMKKRESSQSSQAGATSGTESGPCEPGEPCEDTQPNPLIQIAQFMLNHRAESQKKMELERSQASQSTFLEMHPVSDDTYEPEECEPSELSLSIPPEMLAPLRELIRGEIESFMTAKAASVAKSDTDKPPRPGKRKDSRKLQGSKVTLPGMRVDKVLYDRFKDSLDSGTSASALMERILWLHFGKPKLSFEGD